MTPTEKLHAHHEKLIGTIRSLVDRAIADYADATLLFSYCGEYLLSHAEAEEVTLYKADEDAGFVENMIREHREIKRTLEAASNAYDKDDSESVISAVRSFVSLLNKHFDEEEKILMPRLSAKLSPQDFEGLITEAHRVEADKKKADVRSLFEYDHKRIDRNILLMRRSAGNMDAVRQFYALARAQLLKHIELEESLLFTSFGEHSAGGQMGPVQVMIAEHREITSLISTPADRVGSGALAGNVEALVGKLAVHNKKEELILYPLIVRTIPRGDRDKLYKECIEGLMRA